MFVALYVGGRWVNPVAPHRPCDTTRTLYICSNDHCDDLKDTCNLVTCDQATHTAPAFPIRRIQFRLTCFTGIAQLQKNAPDFHAKKFPPVANKILTDFFDAHRKGDLFALAGLTTEELYATLKVGGGVGHGTLILRFV